MTVAVFFFVYGHEVAIAAIAAAFLSLLFLSEVKNG